MAEAARARHLGRQSRREWSGRAVYLKFEPTLLYTYAHRAGG